MRRPSGQGGRWSFVVVAVAVVGMGIAWLLAAGRVDRGTVSVTSGPTVASRGPTEGGEAGGALPEASVGQDLLVAYDDTRYGGLYLVREGEEPVRLYADSGSRYREVDWSPDGTWFVFTALGERDIGLYRGDRDGTAPILLSGGAGSVRSPHVSPDGATVVFGRGEGASTWVVPAEGGQQREVTAPAALQVTPDFGCSPLGRTHVVPAGWSADGAEILVSLWAPCGEVAFAELAFVPPQGEGGRTVADQLTALSSPALSDDRSLIAFQNDMGIQVVDAEGRQVGRVTGGSAPAFAPDGTLAYVRATDPEDAATHAIWAAPQADPSREREVAGSVGHAHSLEWSPDGSHLAFLTPSERSTDLTVVTVEDGRAARLELPGDGHVIDHAYAP